ncbi:class I SAM-dependent methyltransferase [Actinoplanes sp. NPDC004185]
MEFDRDYWEHHWHQAHPGAPATHPYLARETSGLIPGTALDAGCGTGAEAVWLASHGWQVTAADISAAALARAAEQPGAENVRWVQSDLTTWYPDTRFDLVTTHYAHPAMPQLAFYQRLSGWVAPGGTLLIVGHLHSPAAKAVVKLADITATLDSSQWHIATAEEHERTAGGHSLQDVVVRATRRSGR